jgi:hypothetical protein
MRDPFTRAGRRAVMRAYREWLAAIASRRSIMDVRNVPGPITNRKESK